MLIYAMFFPGKNRRAGVAVKAWKRRAWGGAVQEKHSLALVRGWTLQLSACLGMSYEGETDHFKGINWEF